MSRLIQKSGATTKAISYCLIAVLITGVVSPAFAQHTVEGYVRLQPYRVYYWPDADLNFYTTPPTQFAPVMLSLTSDSTSVRYTILKTGWFDNDYRPYFYYVPTCDEDTLNLRILSPALLPIKYRSTIKPLAADMGQRELIAKKIETYAGGINESVSIREKWKDFGLGENLLAVGGLALLGLALYGVAQIPVESKSDSKEIKKNHSGEVMLVICGGFSIGGLVWTIKDFISKKSDDRKLSRIEADLDRQWNEADSLRRAQSHIRLELEQQ